ncbi:HTH-type transcriptional activator CmpR [Paraburkholderia domus]|uniref:HTH-type transcriptional activator CmpR n=1 Tax=Paraburkholderia domus TaxID=2793075 RepID=A0A9N8N2P4_9BURK|nr:LysR family transcriptional regulator [Paraburkholderia domus]MBK5050325.1 LysR family transcriptional regulator [Burkholderia sp. R-70006]MBK5062388.1 LysR family transcriptional regulator [Burkholderia sp. R-70199]MBK5089263.1 LysR family transcriptional regulator [Burkholderia sp. R-69927]MBK5118935.1 LysR family transcriptional regulator [Burkholderia sp. R-69980]MBK5168098.1 LysR family transcriptional regulator [Burkholderia sp. R-70211]MBK5183336.1 LysR family transcriptional regula
MENLLKKLDLTSLRLFVAVCQEQNIARAAEREFIASSAVSRRIAEIEAMIGLPVIQRQSRGITVTPVGETVLRYAQAIIGNIEQMSAELSRFSSGAKGRVRLVANLSSIVQFLPEDVAAFGRVFPEVSIELEEENSADVLRIVGEHGADFGICNPVAGSEAFQQVPYREDRLVVLVPGGHRLADVPRVAFEALLADSFVGLRSESALTQLLAQQAASAGRQLDVKIRVGSLDALCRMVHAGLGIAVVPEQVGLLYVNALDVRLLSLSDAWAVRHLIMIFKSRDQLSASAAALVGFLGSKP